MMMSKDEFDKLAADQKKLIVESSSLPDTISLNPASELPPPPSPLPPGTNTGHRGVGRKVRWKEGMNLINCAVVASCCCKLSSLGKLSEEEADDWA